MTSGNDAFVSLLKRMTQSRDLWYKLGCRITITHPVPLGVLCSYCGRSYRACSSYKVPSEYPQRYIPTWSSHSDTTLYETNVAGQGECGCVDLYARNSNSWFNVIPGILNLSWFDFHSLFLSDKLQTAYLLLRVKWGKSNARMLRFWCVFEPAICLVLLLK